MLLSQKFGMEYTDQEGKKVNPYIIHRTSMGCYERTLALLIEKYAGAFPTWLAPTQVIFLPFGNEQMEYTQALADKFAAKGMRVEIDTRNEKIGYKIRSAQLQKIPYMVIIGEKEAQEGTISVRSRKQGEMGKPDVDAFINDLLDEINEKRR